jgi:hypothetical protein
MSILAEEDASQVEGAMREKERDRTFVKKPVQPPPEDTEDNGEEDPKAKPTGGAKSGWGEGGQDINANE